MQPLNLNLVRHFSPCLMVLLLLSNLIQIDADETKKLATDRDRLRGSWYVTRMENEGVVSPDNSLQKLVITEKTMTLPGLPSDEYRVDEMRVPKHLDWGFHPGIYKLDGDKFTFCMPSEGSTKVKRPTKFRAAAGDGLYLIEFQRAKPLPKDAPDKDFDKSLHQAIAEGIKLLETKRIEDFLKRFVPPSQLEQFQGDGFKQLVERFDLLRLETLSTFRVLPKLQPKLRTTEAGTTATFNLTRIHIPDGTSRPILKFRQAGDKWHLVEGPDGED